MKIKNIFNKSIVYTLVYCLIWQPVLNTLSIQKVYASETTQPFDIQDFQTSHLIPLSDILDDFDNSVSVLSEFKKDTSHDISTWKILNDGSVSIFVDQYFQIAQYFPLWNIGTLRILFTEEDAQSSLNLGDIRNHGQIIFSSCINLASDISIPTFNFSFNDLDNRGEVEESDFESLQSSIDNSEENIFVDENGDEFVCLRDGQEYWVDLLNRLEEIQQKPQSKIIFESITDELCTWNVSFQHLKNQKGFIKAQSHLILNQLLASLSDPAVLLMQGYLGVEGQLSLPQTRELHIDRESHLEAFEISHLDSIAIFNKGFLKLLNQAGDHDQTLHLINNSGTVHAHQHIVDSLYYPRTTTDNPLRDMLSVKGSIVTSQNLILRFDQRLLEAGYTNIKVSGFFETEGDLFFNGARESSIDMGVYLKGDFISSKGNVCIHGKSFRSSETSSISTFQSLNITNTDGSFSNADNSLKGTIRSKHFSFQGGYLRISDFYTQSIDIDGKSFECENWPEFLDFISVQNSSAKDASHTRNRSYQFIMKTADRRTPIIVRDYISIDQTNADVILESPIILQGNIRDNKEHDLFIQSRALTFQHNLQVQKDQAHLFFISPHFIFHPYQQEIVFLVGTTRSGEITLTKQAPPLGENLTFYIPDVVKFKAPQGKKTRIFINAPSHSISIDRDQQISESFFIIDALRASINGTKAPSADHHSSYCINSKESASIHETTAKTVHLTAKQVYTHNLSSQKSTLDSSVHSIHKGKLFGQNDIQTHHAFLEDVQTQGQITLTGKSELSRAIIDQFDGLDTSLVQDINHMVIRGNNTLGRLSTNHHTQFSPHSKLTTEHLSAGENQRTLFSFGELSTQQKILIIKAEKEIFIRNLKRILGDQHIAFEQLVFNAQKIDLTGDIHSDFLTCRGDTISLSRASVMAKIFQLIAKKNADLEQTYLDVSKTVSLHAGSVALDQTSIEAQELKIDASSAMLSPDQYHTKHTRIKLGSYVKGIEGVLKLAHDLVHSESVFIDAETETLVIDKPTKWRPNIGLSLQEISIDDRLQSEGFIELEAQNGAKVKANVKAQDFALTAHHGDLNFYQSVLDIIDNLSLVALDGHYEGTANTYQADQIGMFASKDLREKGIKKRTGDSHNFQEYVQHSMFTAKDDISIFSNADIVFEGLATKSDGQITIEAQGSILDQVISQERQETWWGHRSFTQNCYKTHVRPTHLAKGKVLFKANKRLVSQAPIIESESAVQLHGEEGVDIQTVYDEHRHFHQSSRKSGGLFGGTKTETISRYSQNSVHSSFQSPEKIYIISRQDINLTNAHFASPLVIAESMFGAVKLLAGENHEQYMRQMTYSNAAWQRMAVDQRYDKTYSLCSFEGEVQILSKELFIHRVEGKILTYLEKLQNYQGVLHEDLLTEIHDRYKTRKGGPSAALSVVVALGVTLATGGIAAPSVTAAMITAAESALYTQAALCILNTEGNLGRAAQKLASADTIKNMAMAAATAGLTKGVGTQLGVNLNPQGFVQQAQYHTLQIGIQAAVGATFEGRIDFDRLAKSFVAGVAGGVIANEIGAWYAHNYQESLNYGVHKVLHGLNGAMMGGILDGSQGIAAGALGAVVAEIAAESLLSLDEQLQIFMCDGQEALTQAQNRVKDIVRLSTAILAGVLNQDVNVALTTVTNALDNNFQQLLMCVIAASTGAYLGVTTAELVEAYETGGWEEVLKICQIETHTIMVYENAVAGQPAAQAGAVVVGAAQRVAYKVGGRIFSTAKEAHAFIVKSYPKLAQLSKSDFIDFIHKKTPLFRNYRHNNLSKEQLKSIKKNDTLRSIAGENVYNKKGKKIPIREIDSIILEYGGDKKDWVKVASKSSKNSYSQRYNKFEIHAYLNLKTREVIKAKTVLNNSQKAK